MGERHPLGRRVPSQQPRLMPPRRQSPSNPQQRELRAPQFQLRHHSRDKHHLTVRPRPNLRRPTRSACGLDAPADTTVSTERCSGCSTLIHAVADAAETDSSLAGRPLLERHGFLVVEQQSAVVRAVAMANPRCAPPSTRASVGTSPVTSQETCQPAVRTAFSVPLRASRWLKPKPPQHDCRGPTEPIAGAGRACASRRREPSAAAPPRRPGRRRNGCDDDDVPATGPS